MGFLQGKRALITGIASERSIATGIAEAMHREGAELAFTYQTEKLRTRVESAAQEYGSNIVLPLDVADDAQIEACFTELGKHWIDGFDILIARVPVDASPSAMRKVAARLRQRDVVMLVLGDPGPLSCDGVLTTGGAEWIGLGDGQIRE